MAIDAALGRLGIKPGVCTSSTRPANPYSGQVIYETDTNRTLVYDNAAWLVVADNQVLSIDSANGRVGVGTTTPSTKLQVDGTITATAFTGQSTSFPTSLDTGTLSSIQELQAKVGVNGSAVTTSLDYQLGYVRIANAAFTNVASFDVTGFSADFNVYKLMLSYNRHTSGVADVTAQIRLGGSTYTSGYYGGSWYVSYLGGSGVFSSRNNGSNFILPDCAFAPPSIVDMAIRGPSDQTFACTYMGYDTGNSHMVTGGFSNYLGTTTFDSLRISATANITGTWYLSGVRS